MAHWWPAGTLAGNPCGILVAALHLGACDESDANGEFALCAPTQEAAAGVLLVLQAQNVQQALDFLRALVLGQAFQLHRRCGSVSSLATAVPAGTGSGLGAVGPYLRIET